MELGIDTTQNLATRVIPVVEIMPADLLTPLSVFLTLSSESRNCFLLESVEGGETLARYSFIGADPEMIVEGNDQKFVVTETSGARRIEQPIFDFLREHFSVRVADAEPDL